ncbi:MAG TPA: hypothetical protein VF421_02900, partial [Niabella sp.]
MKKILSGVLICLLTMACQKDVLKGYKSPERAILFYTIDGQIGKTVITRSVDSSVVTVTVPPTMDLTAIKPQIAVSESAAITPASGEAVDFST